VTRPQDATDRTSRHLFPFFKLYFLKNKNHGFLNQKNRFFSLNLVCDANIIQTRCGTTSLFYFKNFF